MDEEMREVLMIKLYDAHLILTSVSLEAAPALLPAFNGDEQFNIWSGYGSEMTIAETQRDIQETLDLPGGAVWRIADTTNTLVGVAETALLPRPSTAWISLLIIMREFQGCGYGSHAAAQLEKHLFSYPHITRIGLAALVQNAPAQTFWEKRGYVRGKRCADTQGHDVYEYHLPLLSAHESVSHSN
jgi:RimJ/RimL family protein N-acetyltransferase